VSDSVTGVLVGFAESSVAETVKVEAPVIFRIQYVTPPVKPPTDDAGMNDMPANTATFEEITVDVDGTLDSVCETVTSPDAAVVSVIVSTACAFAIFSGRPICFLLCMTGFSRYAVGAA
jgi:hypothetical protein